MPEFLHPGVYVLELPSAVRPIEGVSTSTAGFVGVADKGPVPGFPMPFGPALQPPLVTSFTEFTRIFGSYRTDSYLAYSVQNFFDNGGKRAYVVRVVVFDDQAAATYPTPTSPDNARVAAIGLADREPSPRPTLAVIAQSPGAWANTLSVRISDGTLDPDSTFKLTVLDHGLPVEAFDDLTMDNQLGDFVDDVVNTRSGLIFVKAVVPSGVAPDIARPAVDQVLKLTGDGGRPSLDVTAAASLGGPFTLVTTRTITGGRPTFRLVIQQGGRVQETFEGLSLDESSGGFVERKVNGASRLVTMNVTPTSPPMTDFDLSRPTDGSVVFGVASMPAGISLTADAGADGKPLGEGDRHYLGRAESGTGLRAFDQVTDVNILAIPGQGNDLIVSGGMAYCRNRVLQDAFFVGDVGLLGTANARQPGAVPDRNDKADARDFVRALSTPNDYGAVYYPWIRVSDPIGRGRNPTIALPPSGFMSGVYARIDNARGVFKAPAGTETGLAGALGLLADIQDADQDSLNPIGLNVLRRFPVYGAVAWGARTLATDPAWRYVPVRRMAIFLRASIYRGIQWAVFEPNDEPLWAELRLNIRAFMLTQFRAGAFQGSTPADAFLVKCDSSTTTQQDIDNGVVNILVAFAPLKPAEFVVLKLSQKVNQPQT
jgi:phage tail sheath protein FI